jgi:hypothetical protein
MHFMAGASPSACVFWCPAVQLPKTCSGQLCFWVCIHFSVSSTQSYMALPISFLDTETWVARHMQLSAPIQQHIRVVVTFYYLWCAGGGPGNHQHPL